jgi:hypothetical protein
MHCRQLPQKVTKAYESVVIGIYAQSERLRPIHPKLGDSSMVVRSLGCNSSKEYFSRDSIRAKTKRAT